MHDLKIFIVHYTPLIERKQYIIKQLNDLSIQNYEFIEKYDREELNTEMLAKFNKKKVKLSEISLFKKQMHTMQLIQNSSFKFNILVEDDAVFDEKFVHKLKNGLKQLPNNYDMLFIDAGCGLHIKKTLIEPGKLIYEKCREKTSWGGAGATRGTGGILISKECSKQIYEFFKQTEMINLPVDWWMNDVIRDLKLNVYWMEPVIIKQGSITGKFKRL